MNESSIIAVGSSAWLRAWAGYILIGGIIAFAWLGSSDVVSMEGIVADGARHIERTGQIWVPHLYGEPYNYKPPIVYWMALGSFRLFGVENEWTLRLPIAMCGFLSGAAILALLGGVIGPGRAAVSAIAAISGMIVIQKSRLAEFDTPLALGVGLATCCALRMLITQRGSWWLWPLAYVGLTFGLLAKGIPAVMVFGPALIVAAFVVGRLRSLFGPAHLLSFAGFCGVAAYYVWSVQQEFGLDAFRQTFSEAQSRGSAWTLLAVLVTLAKPAIVAVIFLPWSPMILLAFDREWRMSLDDPIRRTTLGALSFLAAGVLAFMIVPTHETRYYVPLMTAFGIVVGIVCTTGESIARWTRLRRIGVRLTALGVGIVAIVFTFVAARELLSDLEFEGTWLGIAVLATCGVTTVTLAAGAARRLGSRDAAAMQIAAAMCAWAFVTLYDVPKRAADRSLHRVAQAFAGEVVRDELVWVDFDDDHSSLIFYLGCDARWFRRSEGWPPVGAKLIVYKDHRVDQLGELSAAFPGRVESLAEAAQRHWTFTLCRVRADSE